MLRNSLAIQECSLIFGPRGAAGALAEPSESRRNCGSRECSDALADASCRTKFPSGWVNFSTEHEFSQQLNRLLELVCRSPVEILSIRSGGEIEDAFLKRLEADRLKGFSRVFDTQPSTQSQRVWPGMAERNRAQPGELVTGVPELAEEQKV